MAETCLNSLQTTDAFGRFGGEEFAAVLVEPMEKEAFQVAERLRQNISEIMMNKKSTPIQFTVSIGVSTIKDKDNSLEDIILRADSALYNAKSKGRNCVMQI